MLRLPRVAYELVYTFVVYATGVCPVPSMHRQTGFICTCQSAVKGVTVGLSKSQQGTSFASVLAGQETKMSRI